MDLEVGAVDELLVGECVVRDRDKGKKHYVTFSLWLLRSPLLLLTNNNYLKLFIRQS
jgi:hypothetical protein